MTYVEITLQLYQELDRPDRYLTAMPNNSGMIFCEQVGKYKW